MTEVDLSLSTAPSQAGKKVSNWRREIKSDKYQEEIIHKKRKQAWHRSGAIASCGVVLYEVLPMLDFKIHARSSYFWKDVNCKKCLEFLEIKLVDHVKKHK